MESVLALSAVIGPEVDKQISWLQSKGLLGRNKLCPACNQPMDMQQRRVIHRWPQVEVPSLNMQEECVTPLRHIL